MPLLEFTVKRQRITPTTPTAYIAGRFAGENKKRPIKIKIIGY